jgi:hypothetical protein
MSEAHKNCEENNKLSNLEGGGLFEESGSVARMKFEGQ